MSFSPRSVRGTTVRATATDRGRAMDMSCPKARVVSPAGFEPAIPALKGRCPWPLDDGDDRDGPGEPCRIRTGCRRPKEDNAGQRRQEIRGVLPMTVSRLFRLCPRRDVQKAYNGDRP